MTTALNEQQTKYVFEDSCDELDLFRANSNMMIIFLCNSKLVFITLLYLYIFDVRFSDRRTEVSFKACLCNFGYFLRNNSLLV